MNTSERIAGTIKSTQGFYIGDICYVLDEETYSDFWGQEKQYDDGIHHLPGSDLAFAVASTAYGDGDYRDNKGHEYLVDAGIIGLVPLELVKKETSGGHIFPGAGTAHFDAENGQYTITLPGGTQITIDTDIYEDDDDDWEDDTE